LSETIYNRLGGNEAIDRLVEEFYRVMASDPKARECFLTHAGRDINEAAEKLRAFLSGWTGGPQLYVEKYGHPRLRMRHLPFRIRTQEAQQWLYCMDVALENTHVDPELHEELMQAFLQVASLMRNHD
jgi:hemoglobin